MFDLDIAEQAQRNSFFRQVLSTGEHSQVVVMCIPPGGDIGDEVHADRRPGPDLRRRRRRGDPERRAWSGPAGPARVRARRDRHNFVNTGSVDMRLYTIYAPPEHAPGTVHRTKAEADAAEAVEAAELAGGTLIGARR